MDYKELTSCRFCTSANLKEILDLGQIPLVNNLLTTQDQECKKYPLKVLYCYDCTMMMLSIVVDPTILYSNYCYQSGISKGFVQHCKELEHEISTSLGRNRSCSVRRPFVISIAENDGTFLEQFLFNNSAVKVLGIEPAKNLCEIARSKGVFMVNKFFDASTALDVAFGHGEADYIVAQNVFAHVDNVYEFMNSAKGLLKENGTIIIEVPWAGDTISQGDYGQVYAEHLSYITVTGMIRFAKQCGLEVVKIKYFDVLHCGTIRFYLKRNGTVANVSDLWEINNATYREKCILENIEGAFRRMKHTQYIDPTEGVVGVGASAKGTVFLNYLNFNNINLEKSVIYDNTPTKIGKFQPGTRIPIKDFNLIKDEKREIMILAWNWETELIKNVRAINPEAKFYVPFPIPYRM